MDTRQHALEAKYELNIDSYHPNEILGAISNGSHQDC